MGGLQKWFLQEIFMTHISRPIQETYAPRTGPNSGRWARQLRVCGQCQKEIWVVKHKLKKTNFCNKECFDKWQKVKGNAPMFGRRGAKHPRWKGGTTELAKIIKQSFDYRNWRTTVFRRDSYICQKCGKKGGELHAHHIKTFALFPELRCEVSNGVTLCADCHRETETYAGRGLKRKKITTD